MVSWLEIFFFVNRSLLSSCSCPSIKKTLSPPKIESHKRLEVNGQNYTPSFPPPYIVISRWKKAIFLRKGSTSQSFPINVPALMKRFAKSVFIGVEPFRQRENRAVLTAWELVVNGTSSSRRRQQQRYSFARNAAAAVYWCQFLRLIVNAKKKVCPTTVTIRQKSFLTSPCFFLVYLHLGAKMFTPHCS